MIVVGLQSCARDLNLLYWARPVTFKPSKYKIFNKLFYSILPIKYTIVKFTSRIIMNSLNQEKNDYLISVS